MPKSIETSDVRRSFAKTLPDPRTSTRWRQLTTLALSLLLSACANQPTYVDPQAPIGASPWALGSGNFSDFDAASDVRSNATVNASALPSDDRPKWLAVNLIGKKVTDYTAVLKDGRHAVRAQSDSSASLLRQKIRVPSDQLQSVKFSWNVSALIAQANMALRQLDDSPVRVVLAFEGDRNRFSAKNAMLSELSQTLTGEPMPYATLMYVWCNTCAPGAVIVNPRTDRIRKIAVESGAKNLNQWQDYERDIKADFLKAFGEAPGALVGIAIMTDTDNTRSKTTAWYGKVKLGPTDKLIAATPAAVTAVTAVGAAANSPPNAAPARE